MLGPLMKKLAELSKLELDAAELAGFAEQMGEKGKTREKGPPRRSGQRGQTAGAQGRWTQYHNVAAKMAACVP